MPRGADDHLHRWHARSHVCTSRSPNGKPSSSDALVHGDDVRFVSSSDEQRELAERFASACRTGQVEALVAVLDPGCVGDFDSGGMIPGAPLEALVGALPIATVLSYAFRGAGAAFVVADVNGEAGVVVSVNEQIAAVVALGGHDGSIDHIHGIGNPDKLRHLIDWH